MLPLSLSVLPAPAGSPSLRYPGRVWVRWVCCAPVRAAVCGSGATARSARAAHSAQCVGSASSHCTAASACRSASSSSVIQLMSDLLRAGPRFGPARAPSVIGGPPWSSVPLALCKLFDFLLRHRLQPRQKGFHLPLRHVIGQDEFFGLRPDDVGYPVVEARRAPPGNGEPAERHTTTPSDFCQRLPARFHEAPLLARRLSVSRRICESSYGSDSIEMPSLETTPSRMSMLRLPASNAYAGASRRPRPHRMAEY